MNGLRGISKIKIQLLNWRNYPNNLHPSILSNRTSGQKEKDKFPNWYKFLHNGDRIKLEVPGHTLATARNTYETYGTILFTTSVGIQIEVESWSGFGTYRLHLTREMQEKILWHAAGNSSRILRRMKEFKKIQAERVEF